MPCKCGLGLPCGEADCDYAPRPIIGRITPLTATVPMVGDPPGSISHGVAAAYNPNRVTPVGDLRSEVKGSGARDNAGKLPAELLPYTAVARLLPFNQNEPVRDALFELGDFQAGVDDALHGILLKVALAAGLTFDELIAEAARVFAYGIRKYKAWNWAKGMPYSVAMACIYRHLMGDAGKPGMWQEPTGKDAESGLMHAGHVACNVLMLSQWLLTYQEGDDRSEHLRRPPF